MTRTGWELQSDSTPENPVKNRVLKGQNGFFSVNLSSKRTEFIFSFSLYRRGGRILSNVFYGVTISRSLRFRFVYGKIGGLCEWGAERCKQSLQGTPDGVKARTTFACFGADFAGRCHLTANAVESKIKDFASASVFAGRCPCAPQGVSPLDPSRWAVRRIVS